MFAISCNVFASLSKGLKIRLSIVTFVYQHVKKLGYIMLECKKSLETPVNSEYVSLIT